MATFLDTLIYGYRTILGELVEVAQRNRLNFGEGFAVADDAVNSCTTVTSSPTTTSANASDVHVATGAVQHWTPSEAPTFEGVTAAGFTTTGDNTPADLLPFMGDPDAVDFDDDDFTLQASAVVFVHDTVSDVREVFRVSRCFGRDGGGAVAALDATSDDGASPSAPTFTVPTIAWDATTKAPKLTVTGHATNACQWRAVFAFSYAKDV